MLKIPIFALCLAVIPFVPCQAQEFPANELPQEQIAKLFLEGKVVSGSKYDVIRDITIVTSVQKAGEQGFMRVSFSSPNKSVARPDAISVVISEVHPNFEWNFATDVTLRCGDKTFGIPGTMSDEGEAAYKCELNSGGGWIESYHFKISPAQLDEICSADSPYLRVGRNTKHTFDLAASGKGAFLSIQRAISQLEPAKADERNESQVVPSAPEYSVTEFDALSSEVPAHYMGHDPFVVAENFVKLALPKTEFETTADFNRRKSLLLKRPFVGSLFYSSDFVVQLDQSAYSATFDADKQMLNVELGFGSYLPSASIKATTLKLKDQTIPLGSYRASNSFGVEKEVLKYKNVEVGFEFSNFKDFQIKLNKIFGAKDVGVQIPMTTELAKRSKSNLRVLLRYSPLPPYLSYYHNFVTPKVSSPLEKDLHWYYLHGQAKELLFYDFESGQILYKWKSKN